MVKHGALKEELFEKLLLRRRELAALNVPVGLIADNIAFKASVVAEDAKESGLRKSLNLGHTTAHALELALKTRSHGECVLLGTIFEAEIARRHENCDEGYLDELISLCKEVLGSIPALPPAKEWTPHALLDKKKHGKGRRGRHRARLPRKHTASSRFPLRNTHARQRDTGKIMLKLAVIGKDVFSVAKPRDAHLFAARAGRGVFLRGGEHPPEKFHERAEGLFETYDAFNVTIPFKTDIMPYLKELKGDAKTFGAVNVVLSESRTGYNTDGMGFLLMLENAGVSVQGKDVLVLGRGRRGQELHQEACGSGRERSLPTSATKSASKRSRRSRLLCPPFRGGGAAVRRHLQLHGHRHAQDGGHDALRAHQSGRAARGRRNCFPLCDTAVDLIYVPKESEFLRIARTLGKKTGWRAAPCSSIRHTTATASMWGREPKAEEAKRLYEEYLKAQAD